MKFAHAGLCEACLANDLLFAKANGSGQIFFVCAACTAAGTQKPTADLPPWEQSLRKQIPNLAPDGWTLALVSEVFVTEANETSKPVAARDKYEALLVDFPGFQFRPRS